MPRYRPRSRVRISLREFVPQRGLRGKVHVAEEELAREGSGWFGCGIGARVGGYGGLDAPVEVARAEGAEVEVWGEERGALGEAVCGGGGWFGEGDEVSWVFEEGVEGAEGESFATSVGGCCWWEAEFGEGGDGEGVVWAGE